jgi:hypothetical protein
MASARAKINANMVKAVSMALASERVAREEGDRSLLASAREFYLEHLQPAPQPA